MLDPQELAPEIPRLLKRWEFERMLEVGIFEDERVELLRGVVVRMTPPSPPHDATLQRLTRLLVRAVGERGWVRVGSAWAANGFGAATRSVRGPSRRLRRGASGAGVADHRGRAELAPRIVRSNARSMQNVGSPSTGS